MIAGVLLRPFALRLGAFDPASGFDALLSSRRIGCGRGLGAESRAPMRAKLSSPNATILAAIKFGRCLGGQVVVCGRAPRRPMGHSEGLANDRGSSAFAQRRCGPVQRWWKLAALVRGASLPRFAAVTLVCGFANQLLHRGCFACPSFKFLLFPLLALLLGNRALLKQGANGLALSWWQVQSRLQKTKHQRTAKHWGSSVEAIA